MFGNKTSIYRNFDTVKLELAAKCPSLVLITSRTAFYDSLSAFDLERNGMGPIHHKISMSNSNGDIKIDTIQNFLRGSNKNLTGQQKEGVRQKLISTNRKVFEREHASVESLTALFASDIKLVDLTTMHECGASDGYFDREQGESEFVGFQVTRATVQPDKAFQICMIHKSKDFIVRQVCELGFAFFALLYVEYQCRGIVVLTPHDEALIKSLPNFAMMKLKPTRGPRPARKGSLASKLNSCIFLWSSENIAAVHKKIISKVKTFVSHEGIKKYSVLQFEFMMSDNHRIEFAYIRSFKIVVPNAERMPSHQPGDVQFVQNDYAGVVTMEIKLCCLDRTSSGFECLLYNLKHDMECWVNRISAFACVILDSDNTTREQELCNPEVFKCVSHDIYMSCYDSHRLTSR
jgi:hypothetical protein